MDAFKFTSGDIAALCIFGVAVVARVLAEFFSKTPGDYGWITNFAAIAAAWLSLGTRSRDIHNAAMAAKDVAEKVEENTNGKLTAALEAQTKEIVSELKPEDVEYEETDDDIGW